MNRHYFYSKKQLYPNRAGALKEYGSADVTVFGASGTGCHIAIEQEIENVLLTRIPDHIYIYADKSAIRSYYKLYENNGRVHFCDISKIGLEIPQKEKNNGFDRGNTAWIYVDLYNVPITERAISNLKKYIGARVGKEGNEIRTFICNRYTAAASCFAKEADAIVIHPLDEDSANVFLKEFTPAGLWKKLKFNMLFKPRVYKKGHINFKKAKILIGVRHTNGHFFKKGTAKLLPNHK